MARPGDKVTSHEVSLHPTDPVLSKQVTGDKEIAQLKAEISETQGELHQTLAEIEERLSPAQIAERAKDTVREATIGRVKDMANRAGDTAGRMAEQTRDAIPERIRENPLPIVMMGAGLAWLLARELSRRGTGDYSRDYERHESSWDESSREWNEPGRAGNERYSAHDEGLSRQAREQLHQTTERMRRKASSAQDQFGRMMRENPIALGAVALAAGALIGGMLPATQTENTYLGEARDNMMESAREMASQTAERIAGDSGSRPSDVSTGETPF